ncbi:MAG: extracellular solute-binding protein [Erysipelotrichaceae bacterium]|nr:extracellular solute-binding protein [Erysipelotrichaceae bacterium]
MKKNLLMLSLISMLSLTIAGCGDNDISDQSVPSNPVDNSSDNQFEESSSSKDIYESISDESYKGEIDDDYTGLIPEKVLNANVSIDFLVYIEGQDGYITDIGNYSPDPNDTTYRYHKDDVTSIEMAKYFGAASAFKKLAPNVKINLRYCSIGDYDYTLKDYVGMHNGSLPHLMWGTRHVVEQLSDGYCYDLSRYADSEYYQQYNEYFMSRFNFGGFQAGLPIAGEPWGVFVNLNNLEEYSIVSDVVDETLQQNTDAYKEWVDNFTWDNFVSAVDRSTNDTHAGLSRVVEYFTSYSVPSINSQFIANGSVDISSSEVINTITKLLNYEQTLSQNCVYMYDMTSTGHTAKDNFPNAKNWLGTQNFVVDQYCTFYAEAPWALTTISQYAKEHSSNIKADFLPYPKLDADTSAYSGIAVEGLTVGNQCPIGTVCTEDKQLEMDVAAYFAMFMGLDPRAIQARSEVTYNFNGTDFTGDLALPITKRGSKFSFQTENPDLDPAIDYVDNWTYQMKKWFDVYDLYVIADENGNKDADVEYFSNITYGLVKMLDSVYMLDGIGDDYVTCLNYWNEPVAVPDIDSEDEKTKDIFANWCGRFTRFIDKDTQTGTLGTDSYVTTVIARLAEIENEINDNTNIAWLFLQECVDNMYGSGKYDVLDRSYRNSYEGALPN